MFSSSSTKKLRSLSTAIALLLVCAALPAFATTYYVKPDLDGGSDLNDGLSLVTAWATISRADYNWVASSPGPLLPGDVVEVQAGTYDVPYAPSKGNIQYCSGASGNPIVYRANGVVKVIAYSDQIDGAMPAFKIAGVHDIVIDGFEITGSLYSNYREPGIKIDSGSGIEIKNCYIHDFYNNTYTNYIDMTNDGASGVYGSIVIHNNVFAYTGVDAALSTIITTYGGYGGTQTGLRILNNVLRGARTGIYLYNVDPGVEIRNNIFTGSTYAILNDGWGGSLTPITNSHNLYWNTIPDYYASVPDVASEFTADPRFIGGDPYDYHLQASSPAINTGTNVGFLYNGTAPDIGAFETDYATATVSGDVKDPSGAGLGYAAVKAVGTSYSTTADASGHYSLTGLQANTYTVRATFGRVNAEASVTVNPGDSKTQNFTLTPVVKTFYVKVGGDDNADGESIANAWATIANGDTKGLIKPGDTIEVQAGAYAQNVSLASGNGAPGYAVAYRANGAATISPASGTIVLLSSAVHDVTFDGFEMTGSGANRGIGLFGADGITIQNCWIHDLAAGTVFYVDITTAGSDGVRIYKNVFSRSTVGSYAVINYGGTTGLRIQNNTFDKFTVGVYNYAQTDATPVTNNIFANCTTGMTRDDCSGNIVNTYNLYYGNGTDYMACYAPQPKGPGERSGDPMFVGGSPFSYQLQAGSAAVDAGTNIGFAYNGVAPDMGAIESSFTRTGITYHVKPAASGGDDNADGLTLGTAWATIGNGDAKSKLLPLDTVLVEAGTYTANVSLANCNGAPDAAITYKANGVAKINPSGTGISLGAASHDLVIDGFEITGAGMSSCVLYNGSDRITVQNCWMHDLAPGYSYYANVTTAGSSAIYLYRNVFSQSATGRTNYGAVTYGDTADFRIQNNTFANLSVGIYIYALTTTTPVTNNIFVNCDSGLKRDDLSSPVVNTYNLYYGNTYDYNNYYNNAAKNTGEFVADPLFVGGSPFDYHLTGCSPAVDAGTIIGLPGTLGAAPDLGAIELDPAVTVSAKVAGTVTNTATGLAMPGVLVEDLTTGKSTVTSASGSYLLCSTVAGTHTIKCTYGTLTTEANVGFVSGSTVTQNFTFSIANHTYHVKNGGSDSADGLTLGTAWATIDNGDVKQKLVAGDTVLVEPGTFAPMLLSMSAGVADHPITYTANGSGVQVYQSGTDPVIKVTAQAAYNVLDGFDISGAGNSGVKGMAGVDHLTIQNCYMHDLMGASYDSYVDLESGNANGCVIRNNVITATATDRSGLGCGVSVWGSTNTTIVNNTITNHRTGVYTWNHTGANCVLIANNIFQNNQYGISLDGDLSTVVVHKYNLNYLNTTNRRFGVAAGEGEFTSNPLFVGGSPYDYHLTSGSPAVDSGTDVGLAFNGFAPDRGAFESLYFAGTEYAKVSDVKGLAVGTQVKITSAKTVSVSSATFADGSYYIQEPDRFCGIKVKPEVGGLPSVVPGNQITLTGIIRQDANGEKYIGLYQVTKSTGTVPGALGVTNRTGAGATTPKASGLLVRTWGLVTVVTADYIYVDDGSGANDGSGNGNGVRVMLSGLASPITKTFTAGVTFVKGVTGAAGLTTGGVACIRPRGDADISL